jgi:hypothetical protein
VAQHDRITALTGIDPWRVDVTKIDEVVISTYSWGSTIACRGADRRCCSRPRYSVGRSTISRTAAQHGDKAEAMHAEAVALVRGEQAPKIR